tara:strand:- start:11556 stop:13454 length:1899 start_codon:yes stop_codon:yes gene_type:complete
MAEFIDSVRHLLDHPGVRYGAADSPASMVWIEEDTLSKEKFGLDPTENSVTRTLHALTTTNDKKINFSIGDKTYEVTFWVDGASLTPSTTDYSVIIELKSSHTTDQAEAILIAGMKTLPNITPKIIHTTSGSYPRLVIFNDTDRSLDVVASGTGISSTTTQTVKDSGLYFPPGYRPGDPWKKNEYLIVLQTWIAGGDDTHHNVKCLLRADLQRISDDFEDFTHPDDLSGDHYKVAYPYDGDSKEITWTFLVPNDGKYTRQPAGTPHPLFPEALLVGVQESGEDGTLTVTHQYRHIGPAAEQHKQGYTVNYECATSVTANQYPVVQLRLEVLLSGFTPAVPGSVCPIDGTNAGSTNAELNFSASGLNLKLRKPPVLETRGPVYGVVMMEYSRIPSWPDTTRQLVDFPEGSEVFITTLYQLSTWDRPEIDDVASVVAGSDYTDSYITGIRESPQGCGIYRVEIDHAKVPADFTQWGSAGVRFPPLYPAVVSFPPEDTPYPGGRFAFSETVPAKIEYSFTRDPETEAATMPQNVRFESYLMLAVQDALENQDLKEEEVAESVARVWWNQSGILHEILLIDDPYTGAVVTTSTVSSPSSSTYRSWISSGTYYIVKDTLQQWRGKIHMRVKVSVKAR